MRIQILVEPELGDPVQSQTVTIRRNGRDHDIEVPYTQEKPSGLLMHFNMHGESNRGEVLTVILR